MTKFTLSICLLLILAGCGEEQSAPKPLGYFRLQTPGIEYRELNRPCPYSFEINTAARWERVRQDSCWGDIYYPSIKARVQVTYKALKQPGDLENFLEDGRDLAYKHVVKADGIREQLFSYPQKDVHGIFYSIAGNAATSTQFVATDSSQHFLRAVLYFYAAPNVDSLKPVNNYMQEEMLHIIESLQWKNG